MIIGRDLLNTLGLDLKFSGNTIIGGKGPYEGCSAPMVDLSNYYFKSLMENIVKPEEYFIHFYIDKCIESDISINSMRIMRRILEAKCEKSDLK